MYKLREKITTEHLVVLLVENKNVDFEVSLNNGVFNATHFFRYGGKRIYDIGIDSHLVTWNKNDFVKWYSNSKWLIDQIVIPQ